MPLDPLNDPLLRAPRSYAPTITGMTEAANAATPDQLADFVGAIGTSGGGGGGGSTPTDLGATATPTGVTVTSSTGTDAALPLATAVNAGLMDPAQHTKLNDLPTAAQLAADQAAQDLAIGGKAAASHTHTPAAIGAATTAQGAKADTALQPGVLPAGTTLPAAQISDATAPGRALLTAADAAAQRVALALGNANNTADADKPVSTAQALAIAAATTADAIADTLETAPAADLARIQASVSGGAIGVVSAHADALYRNVVNTSSRANTMWQSAIWLPTGVDAVQIVAPSYAADVSMQAGVKFSAQTTNETNLANPHDAATMVAVTWGGAANPTFVAGSAASPGFVVSDITPVRNRGAGVNYAIIRQYYPAGATAVDALYNANPATTGNRATKLAALGVNARYAFAGSDQTANSAASTSTTANAIPLGLRLFSRYRIKSVANFGDSTRQGWNADGLVNAFERYAIASSLAGNPVAVVNAGITGQTSAEYLARLKAFIASGGRADAITYQITSPNDGYSQAISDAQIARAMDAITTVRNAGMQIILDGPFPTTIAGGTPSADKLICTNAALQLCTDMRARGVPVIAYASLHGSTLGAWASTDLSGDGIHQTELATASVIVPAVSAALDSVLR